ncbi:hypothetical protein GQ55_6G285800 [Panicum hallii var. hallii]|uniref:Uncharacterized protein n=1 Tax=Panicum hallii var. hallii TaxID=1504633 RepID=A0A2T7DAN2_9POAL|nr:hypothetical protein GQ55_6G285800 [Panicum hallii var. hallii]
MDAPDHVEQPAVAGASSASPAAGHDPGVTSSVGEDLSRDLAAVLAKARPLATPAAALKHFFEPPPAPASGVAAGHGAPPLLRTSTGSTRVKASRRAAAPSARREVRRLSKLPTDCLRAGQESRDRRRRRGMVRRCVRTLLSLHEDRRNDRVLSAMMARLATMESGAGDGGTTVSAAPGDASAAEQAELAEMIEKMELSFKD